MNKFSTLHCKPNQRQKFCMLELSGLGRAPSHSEPSLAVQKSDQKQVDYLGEFDAELRISCVGGQTSIASEVTRLHRFLILGANDNDSGNDADAEPNVLNPNFIIKLVEDGKGEWLLNQAVDVSESGRATENSPSVFCVAICASYPTEILPAERREALRKLAYDQAFPKVCRTTQDFYQFLSFCDKVSPKNKDWGDLHANAICKWYFNRSPAALALEVTSYCEWEGYNHEDIIRSIDPKPPNGADQTAYDEVLLFVKSGLEAVIGQRKKYPAQHSDISAAASDILPLLRALSELKATSDAE
ncbi:unnamed protein product, partial [Soboliphyme baturini]|uniref:TROVE domain-containing protein n=1 Tax=Soboliphyme baturini TaxID=241478 RepID=A0A183IYE0_9BILA